MNDAQLLLERAPAQILQGNQSLPLTACDNVYWLEQGSIELLSTRFADGTPTGIRRHLGQLGAGNALFGADLHEPERYGFMAVARGPVTLRELTLQQIVDGHLVGSLDIWARRLMSYLSQLFDEPSLANRVEAAGSVELGRLEDLAAARSDSYLIRLSEGELSLFADVAAPFTVADGWLLLPTDSWLRVTSELASVELLPTAETDAASALGEGLANLNRLINFCLARIASDEAEAEFVRRQASRELMHRQSAAAYAKVADVLDDTARFDKRETPLLTAVAAVGRVLGIDVRPPAESEDMRRVANPLEAIARASRVRLRMVLLGPRWWRHDSGPLIGYLGHEQRQPVALLPAHGRYDIVDPDFARRQPLTSEQQEQLCPDAYTLYRSLPERVLGLFDLLMFTAHGRRADIAFILGMGLLATLLGMVAPQIIGVLVDTAVPSADTSLLFQLAGVVAVAGIAGVVFVALQSLTVIRTSSIAEVSAQAAMWDRLLKFRPSFFRQFSSGDLQNRVNTVSVISQELNGATLRPLMSGALALLNLVLLWHYSADLALIAIGLGVIILAVTLVVGHFVRHLSLRLHDLEGAFNGLVIQMIGGVAKLRVAGSEQRAFNHWVEKYAEQLQLSLKLQVLKDSVGIFHLGLPPLASALVFWQAASLSIGLPIDAGGGISLGDFIAFNAAFVLYLSGWSDLSNSLVGVLDTMVRSRRIKPLLDSQPEVAENAADPGRLRGQIRVEQLGFRYVDGGPYILNDVSFAAEPGEFVAFVGPSGSGKSTLLRLLLGFERPESGRVLFDGQELAGLNVEAVRRQIGTVLQNGRLNAGNIFENIANNASITNGEAMDAATDAGLAADIEEFPMGLHTMVSEGGTNLSGGQRQRLLIARALATRPKMVFFDEATSALDNKTQATVSEALERRKVTRLVIAHRLSTIRHADRIYVLREGSIVQTGSFDELQRQPGLFRDLMSRQIT